MYIKQQLMQLQHAILLQALKDIKTKERRYVYYREVRRSLETLAPYYNMTADEMIESAVKSGFIEPFTEAEASLYSIKNRKVVKDE